MKPLTPRQTQVISLIADGLIKKEIADRLGVANRTVECHIENIFKRLSVHTQAHAVSVWLRAGFRVKLKTQVDTARLELAIRGCKGSGFAS